MFPQTQIISTRQPFSTRYNISIQPKPARRSRSVISFFKPYQSFNGSPQKKENVQKQEQADVDANEALHMAPDTLTAFRQAQENMQQLNNSRIIAVEELKSARKRIKELEAKLKEAEERAKSALENNIQQTLASKISYKETETVFSFKDENDKSVEITTIPEISEQDQEAEEQEVQVEDNLSKQQEVQIEDTLPEEQEVHGGDGLPEEPEVYVEDNLPGEQEVYVEDNLPEEPEVYVEDNLPEEQEVQVEDKLPEIQESEEQNVVEQQEAEMQEEEKQKEVEKDTIQLFYHSGWHTAHLHFSADNKGWTDPPGWHMATQYQDGNNVHELKLECSSIEFVLNNGENDWDTPAPEAKKRNYTINTPGVYKLEFGVVQKLS